MKETETAIRVLTIDDYEELYRLWTGIHGFVIRSLDDSKEGIRRFLDRNPGTSMAAVCGGRLIGAILCGHDGRRGCLYHVCVEEGFRKNGIGQRLVNACLEALKKEGINKVNLIAFQKNEIGNRFWRGLNWTFREDVNYYECVLNENNTNRCIP